MADRVEAQFFTLFCPTYFPYCRSWQILHMTDISHSSPDGLLGSQIHVQLHEQMSPSVTEAFLQVLLELSCNLKD